MFFKKTINKTKIMRIFIAILVFTCFSNLFALDQNGLFKRITIEQKLSENTISCILQDRTGFIWIGTSNGLNRYDGHQFIQFRYSQNKPNSLSDSTILSLCEDRDGFLWVGTANSLNRFNPISGQNTIYRSDDSDPQALNNDYIQNIFQDSHGEIWIGTAWGLHRFLRQQGKFERFHFAMDNPATISNNYIKVIFEDTGGRLYIGTENGLNLFERATKTFKRILHDPADANTLSHNDISAIVEDSSKNLWIGTWGGGVNCLKADRTTFKRYRHNPKLPHTLCHDTVTSLCLDRDGSIWIGTENGLNRVDSQWSHIVLYAYNQFDPQSLSDNYISHIMEDRDGLIWVGTDKGINVFDKLKEVFQHYYKDPRVPGSLSDSNVLAVFKDQSDSLWVGTDNGLNNYDPLTDSFKKYFAQPGNPRSLHSNYVRAICQAAGSAMWIGTFFGPNSGLHLFDPQRGVLAFYAHDPKNPNSLSNNNILSLYHDRQGKLWIGTMSGGLNRFDPITGVFTRFRHDNEDQSTICDDWVAVLFEDYFGQIWCGTENGLGCLDPKTGLFTNYTRENSGLSNNRIRAILEDEERILWIASEDGLNRFDPRSKNFTIFSEEQGLIGNMVMSILKADDGYLWLSSSKGITQFNPKTRHITTFDYFDGLFNSDYNNNAGFRDRAGVMYFGGKNGLNVFNPANVHCNTVIPPIVITDFKKFNQSFPLARAVHTLSQITLSYKDIFFSFDFSALNFIRPEKNQFAYKMEGFDRDWVYSGNRGYASFTNLEPGRYTFRVKGSNNCGTWNEKGTVIRIVIIPPYWKTWWFRLFLGFLILFTGNAIYQIRIRRLEKHRKELEKQVAERTQEIAAKNLELERKENLYRSLVETSPDAIIMTDVNGIIIMANQQAAVMYGFPNVDPLIGANSLNFIALEFQRKFSSLIKSIQKKRGIRNIRFQIQRQNGTQFPAEMNASMIHDDQHLLRFMIAVIRDNTEQQFMEKELRRLATTDALTGINNLHRFLERAHDELIRAQRYGKQLAFLLIDIDHFKLVNDTFGHPVGDQVLKIMTERCQQTFRKTDIFGRLGGEEFGALLIETDADTAYEIAERLRKSLEELVVENEKGQIRFTVSIGLTNRQGATEKWEEIYLKADNALYDAKNAGRNSVVQH
jgi:diguanylate cyclase (GGDEF)-like protein/PAS domain S-box-containing protein